MKLLALFLTLLALAGCAPSSGELEALPVGKVDGSQSQELAPRLGQEFTLTPGREALLKYERLKVRFDSVVQDGRCPQGVPCVWLGNAKIRLRLVKAPNGEKMIELNTVEGHDPKEGGNYPAVGTYFGYKVRLVGLSAKPRYEARLLVTKSEG